MARELPDYRDNLEILNCRFPNYDALTITEVAQVLNKSERAVRRDLGHAFVDRRMMKTRLAKYMAGGGI